MKDPEKAAYRIRVGPGVMRGKDLHAALSNGIVHLDSEGGSRNKASEEEKRWFNFVHEYLQ